jgi:PAS domain S-box-containing protein
MIKVLLSKRYLILPLVLVVFFFLFHLIYSDIKERTINEFNNEQLILAETAAQGIASFFKDYQSDLIFLSRFSEVINPVGNSRTAVLENYYKSHKGTIEAVTRVDSMGIILETFPENRSVIGRDISYQKHVQQVIASHKPVISDVFVSAQGYRAIAIHVPVFNGEAYAGSLAILISIDKLGSLYLGKIKIKETGNIWLLSEDGVELYCTVSGHTGKHFLDNTGSGKPAKDLLNTIRASEKGTARGIHAIGVKEGVTRIAEKYIVFYRAPLGNTFWTILISFHEEEIFSVLSTLRYRLIFVFSALFIIIAYYFYSLSNVRKFIREELRRKQTEHTLQISEEKFRTIFDESPIGIELYKADGAQIAANKASLRMFGIPDVEDILGFNLFDGTSLDEEKCSQLKKGQIVSYQAQFNFDKVSELGQYKTEKTGRSWFDYIITPLWTPNSKVISGYLVQIQDVSDRKRAEEEIVFLANALRSVNECVSITDMENRIIFVNEAFSRTYGYEVSELTGNKIDMVRLQDDHSEILDEILPSTIHGEWRGELKNRRKDGSEFPIYLSTTTVKDKAGNLLGLIGIASDITRRKQDEEALIHAKNRAEESDRLKSAFLANMSHEIRTPMNGILGFASLLKEPDLTSEEQLKFIGVIEKSGERMLNLINNIVDISKIEAGLMEISMTDTNVNELFEFICNFFKPEAEMKGLQFYSKNELTDKSLIINTDREKLYAIMTNLVKNAVKYTRVGSLEAGLSEEKGGFLKFYIRDTGIGIPKDRQEAIFERFIQADIHDKMARQGAGLGLSIAKAYVEMLRGRIWLESEPGVGSVFYFTIPK